MFCECKCKLSVFSGTHIMFHMDRDRLSNENILKAVTVSSIECYVGSRKRVTAFTERCYGERIYFRYHT